MEIYSNQITSYKPANLVINTVLLDSGEPQEIAVKFINLDEEEKAIEASSTFIIRSFLGHYEGNIFVMLNRNGKKSAMAKLNLQN